MTEVKMLKVGSPRYPQSSVADRDHSLYQNSIVARPYVWLIQSLISTSLPAASSGLKCFHVLKLHWWKWLEHPQTSQGFRHSWTSGLLCLYGTEELFLSKLKEGWQNKGQLGQEPGLGNAMLGLGVECQTLCLYSTSFGTGWCCVDTFLGQGFTFMCLQHGVTLSLRVYSKLCLST